jgi:hypothetical protein
MLALANYAIMSSKATETKSVEHVTFFPGKRLLGKKTD